MLAAGCGGGATGTAVIPPAARDYRRLWADIHAMKVQAAKVRTSTLLGTRGLRRTTGTFIDDLDRSSLTLKEKNRIIDHAAAAIAPVCEQCFQMLEAIRPIPQIAGH